MELGNGFRKLVIVEQANGLCVLTGSGGPAGRGRC